MQNIVIRYVFVESYVKPFHSPDLVNKDSSLLIGLN